MPRINPPLLDGQVVINDVTFEEFITRAIALREKADDLQWSFGDLAVEFTRMCGNNLLPDLARGVGISISTLRRYRDVSLAFPLEVRLAFPMLSWSHFREVTAKEDKNLLLLRASDENWSVEKLALMAKPDKSDIIDDGKFVPKKPELLFDRDLRLWYIANAKEDGRHVKEHLVNNTSDSSNDDKASSK